MKKITALVLALLLTLSLSFLFSCGKEEAPKTNPSQGSAEEGDNNQNVTPWDKATYKENTTLGEGSKTFTVEICAYNKSITITVNTNASTVGDALSALGLIEGEDGAYGLYVKKVNGILADYDVDGTYWAFYINGEYAMKGVDKTNIEAGASYKLCRE